MGSKGSKAKKVVTKPVEEVKKVLPTLPGQNTNLQPVNIEQPYVQGPGRVEEYVLPLPPNYYQTAVAPQQQYTWAPPAVYTTQNPYGHQRRHHHSHHHHHRPKNQ